MAGFVKGDIVLVQNCINSWRKFSTKTGAGLTALTLRPSAFQNATLLRKAVLSCLSLASREI
jgi:hypothetical protein